MLTNDETCIQMYVTIYKQLVFDQFIRIAFN